LQILTRQLIRPAERGPSIRCGIKDARTPVPVSFLVVFERRLEPELLAESLAGALRQYPLFAGSFRKQGEELFLDCDAHGVVFEVVQHDQPLDDWMPAMVGRSRPGEFVSQLPAGLKPRSCVLHIRVNQLQDAATVLGISFNHAVGDGRTFVDFVKAWSELAAGRSSESPLIPEDRQRYGIEHTLDRSTPSELRLLSVSELAKTMAYTVQHAPRLQRVRFRFTDRELASLHQDLQERATGRISRNDALVAHVLSVIQQVEPRPEGRDVLVAVDERRRSTMSANALGNYMTMVATQCSDGASPEQLAMQLRAAIAAWAPNYHSLARFVADAGGLRNSFRVAPSGLRSFRGALMLSSMAGLGLYEMGFDGEPPSYGLPGTYPLPWFGVSLEGYRRQGVQFHIHVPTATAKRLCAPATLRSLHRYRGDASGEPAQPSWLSESN
jgi:shikimate O-hydroxycinnamoyltransferase